MTTEKLQAIWLRRTHVVSLQGILEDMRERMSSKEYKEYLEPLTSQVQWCLDRGIEKHESPRYRASPLEYYSGMADA